MVAPLTNFVLTDLAGRRYFVGMTQQFVMWTTFPQEAMKFDRLHQAHDFIQKFNLNDKVRIKQ